MSKLRVESFTISLDGYGAGPNQDLDNPLGVGATSLHRWVLSTRTFRQMFGQEGGTTDVDDGFAARGFENIGSWIMGRNMFGPIRGPWPDDTWKGWWGDTPPYHCDVFVLTNHPRASFTMNGGTVFHFVIDGIDVALKRATEAARGRDIRLGGGVATIQQFLRQRLIDEMHIAISSVRRHRHPKARVQLHSACTYGQCHAHCLGQAQIIERAAPQLQSTPLQMRRVSGVARLAAMALGQSHLAL
jgi:dihydrofolate reductase